MPSAMYREAASKYTKPFMTKSAEPSS